MDIKEEKELEAVVFVSKFFFVSHFGFVDSGCPENWTSLLKLVKGHLLFKIMLSGSAWQASLAHKTKMGFKKKTWKWKKLPL